MAAFSGTASAHEVSTVAFCGCTQVTVYGALLEGGDGSEAGSYVAVLYCDGEIRREPLSGTETRQNYDMDADESIGTDDDCQIIALEGTTHPHGSFTICNEHCQANCAAKGLADEQALGESREAYCDDPSTIESGGGGGIPPREGITVQCSGCGRDEPGHPGRPEDPGRGRGRGR